jgi:hypothetical protein
VHANGQLMQVIPALRAAGRLAGVLHGRQEQSDEDRDDGDHDQQFDEREAGPASGGTKELSHAANSFVVSKMDSRDDLVVNRSHGDCESLQSLCRCGEVVLILRKTEKTEWNAADGWR